MYVWPIFLLMVKEHEIFHCRRLSPRNVMQDTKLLEHIGLTEKLTLEREGNAMRQWERRQRDWLRVREDMATKIGKVCTLIVCPCCTFRTSTLRTSVRVFFGC